MKDSSTLINHFTSSFEVGTQLLIAYHRKYITQKILNELEHKIEEFQRMTIRFQNGLKPD